jgi:hypothetical protein
MTSCNACDALSDFTAENAAGYCEDCMCEAETALGNRLQTNAITMEQYNAEFDALHA